MAKIHIWGLDSQHDLEPRGPDGEVHLPSGPCGSPYILFLAAERTEEDLVGFLEVVGDLPTYVVAPDKGNSRDNSITAANTRRLTEEVAPVVVPIRGASRRERMDFVSWLVENEYVPAFPRFQGNGKLLPLGRQQQVAELSELMGRLGPWNWAALNYVSGEPATNMMESADREGRLEAFVDGSPGRVQVISQT